MKRIITIFVMRTLLMFILAKPVYGSLEVADASAQIKRPVVKVDTRVANLRLYLESHRSPLAAYAQVFITKAEAYGLPDWKLVPAITGVESTFGKAIPLNSYNAYGWANGAFAFKSWEDSIDVVTKVLKEKYYNKGADSVEKIARIYAPPSQTWARNVRFFMQKIDTFEPKEDPLALTL